MATPSFDLSGLPLLEAQIAVMVAADSSTPTTFSGAASFNATYNQKPQNIAPTSETTNSIAVRLSNLRLAFDMLNR